MSLRSLKLLLLFVLLAGFSRADEVDRAVNQVMQQYKMPGAAVAVMRDGKIMRAQGYGLANVELNVPVRPEQSFNPDRWVRNSPPPRS